MQHDATDNPIAFANIVIVIRPMAATTAFVGVDQGEGGGISHAVQQALRGLIPALWPDRLVERCASADRSGRARVVSDFA
jgi:hypothetical protein